MKDDWQTMDTAPKDGTNVLGANEAGDVTVMYCLGHGWAADEWTDLCTADYEGMHDPFTPVAWMHLPKPPERKK